MKTAIPTYWTSAAPTRPAMRMLAIMAGVAGMCLAAQVRIPVPGTEVPMTLQSLAAVLCGYFLSPLAAVGAVGAYLVLGAAGLPVFAGSAGLLGSTGGYLAGFVVCALLVSLLKGGRDASVFRLTTAGLIGTATIFVCGIAGQALFKGNLEIALLQGAVPFFGKALVQLMFAVALMRVAAGYCGRLGHNGS